MASGVLYWLAFPGVGLWPLAFVAWVPLYLALPGMRPTQAFGLGVLAGTTASTAGFAWLPETLERFVGVSRPGGVCVLMLLSAYHGVRSGILAWLYVRGVRASVPRGAMFLLAFIASEVAFPMPMPWYFAACVVDVVPLVQVAELGGPVLVGAVATAANIAIAELARSACSAGRWRVSASGWLSATVVLVALSFGVLRTRGVDERARAAASFRVGVLQPNVDSATPSAPRERLARLRALTRKARARGAELVVWTEGALSLGASTIDQGVARPLAGLALPGIVGAVVEDADARRYNSALAVDAEGRVAARYDKRKLFPIGEFVPFVGTFPRLRAAFPRSAGLSPGQSDAPVDVVMDGTTHRVRVLICFEDAFPGLASTPAEEPAELLVALVNDSWFASRVEFEQHTALARLRAVEQRRYFVRAAGSGLSSIIDPAGRIVAQAPAFEADALVGTARWLSGRTLYAMGGDWPWYGLALLAVALSRGNGRARA